MKEITKLLTELLKKDHSFLKKFKVLAVNSKKFELAANIRGVELENFKKVDSDDLQKEIEECGEVITLMSMVGLTIGDLKTAYIFKEGFKVYNKKGDLFDLESASKIKVKASELFD